ncbi:PREDICTED: solute carrier family 23 member 1-like [Priapulus caudatus]|uniref:Solute carrier family 23 member 1-like n=1 Tax=Priapulus caudatus TaxID=37621 RepID=A0ABM1DNX5_PRICU|nr:PREDICTED: solute carrier family 23 member 1-like [Priapulus caudatus]
MGFFVGGMTGFILDNTVAGTPLERGIIYFTSAEHSTFHASKLATYDIPYVTGYLDRLAISRYIPLFPQFGQERRAHHDAADNKHPTSDNSDCETHRV